MRVVIINKSDSTGGAAVVSRRLMHALRDCGVEADMLVNEKLTDDRYVRRVAGPWRRLWPFLLERLQIFLGNGRNRRDLWKVDTGRFGVGLHRDPLVAEADVVCLAWVNQGMLSLREVQKISDMGKPIVWIMHDMWCATGICHHAGDCEGFLGSCGLCPLLGRKASTRDLSARVWKAKKRLLEKAPIAYVAVSNWLRGRARASSLLAEQRVEVIPNPFPSISYRPRDKGSERINIIIAAARLDDPIKGLDIFKQLASRLLINHPEVASRLHFTAVGALKDPDALRDFPLSLELTGTLSQEQMLSRYRGAHIVLSTSLFETLPGTLVEGQACGALPVAFNRGGQPDIITDGLTGVLVPYGDDPAACMEAGLMRGIDMVESTPAVELQKRLIDSVQAKFDRQNVAQSFISLFNSLLLNKL